MTFVDSKLVLRATVTGRRNAIHGCSFDDDVPVRLAAVAKCVPRRVAGHGLVG